MFLWVCATAKGLAKGHAYANVSTGKPVSVQLFEGHTLRGRVVDAEGVAVAGAWVRTGLAMWHLVPIDGGEAQTDAEGRYELPNTMLGDAWVSCWAEGYAMVGDIHQLRPGVPLEIRLSSEEPTKVEVSLATVEPASAAAG